MPLLESFQIEVKTGERGRGERPHFLINGFPLQFDEFEGSTESGQTFKAEGNPSSFPHSLLLGGPDAGAWDIESATVTYFPDGEDPYTVQLGSVTLDDDADLNIWHKRPPQTFEV